MASGKTRTKNNEPINTDEFEVIVGSWQDFLEQYAVKESQSEAQPCFIFRGQANADWGLMSSLMRAISGHSPESALDFEEAARDEFVAQAHLYVGPSLLSSVPTKLHWWMHMQHFHAPTRLLDWSRSPFVAAYFACEQHPNDDGAVWALDVRLDDFSMPSCFKEVPTERDIKKLEQLFLNPEAPKKLCLINMGIRNERMVAQQGLFMVCQNASVQHHDVLCRAAKRNRTSKRFWKIRIGKDKKSEFFRHLRAMNINARSVYPGIDGLGQSITEMARFDAFPDLHR